MRIHRSTLSAALLSSVVSLAAAASAWGFSDATITVHGKGGGVGSGLTEKLDEKRPLSKIVQLGPSDTLKVALTAKDGKTAKRPHQTFLTIKDTATGLETSYGFAVKESGKGKVELTHKDIPTQLLASTSPLSASLIIASFGSSKPYSSPAFELSIQRDPAAPVARTEVPIRYGKLPEIRHIFKADPKNPPKIISLFFTAVVLAALPALFIGWLTLGANVNHLSKAFGTSPISHGLFFGSILVMEGIFFMYYTSWSLFQMLPPAIVVGVVIFISGSRALSEVQERRLAGLR